MPEYHTIARRLSYVAVAYNLLEGLGAVMFATLAGSPALLGFGIDSFVESLSGIVHVQAAHCPSAT